MPYERYIECIEACNHCANETTYCATACLQEHDVKLLVRCIQLSRECTVLCHATSILLSAGSEYALGLCAVCARACRACARECRQHADDICQQCAEYCERCAGECEELAGEPRVERQVVNPPKASTAGKARQLRKASGVRRKKIRKGRYAISQTKRFR